MNGTRIKGYVDAVRSIERVGDLVVIAMGNLLACCLAGEPWNNASQSATAFAIVAFCLLAEIAGLYSSRGGRAVDPGAHNRLGLWVWGAALPLLILFQLISLGVRWHSGLTAIWAVSVGAGIYGWRFGLRRLAGAVRLGRRHNVAILGGTKAAERLSADIEARPWLRMHVMGIYDDRSTSRLPAGAAARRRGDSAALMDACKDGTIDTVIVALPARAQARIQWAIEALGDTTATVFMLADLPSLDLLNAQWTTIGGLAVVALGERQDNAVTVGLRRVARVAFGRLAPAPVVETQTANANAAATEAPPVGPTG